MNSQTALAYAVFLLVCLGLMSLPFVPAWRESRRPTDSAPLSVASDYTTDIDHFAARLRADALARLGQGAATGHEDFAFVTDPANPLDWQQGQRLIAETSIDAGRPIDSPQPLFVQGGLRAPAGSGFTALYATGDIDLGEQSRISDWAHADGSLRVGPRSAAVRRISAGVAVELGNESWFERVQAPAIRFGSRPGRTVADSATGQAQASFMEVPGAVQQTPSLFLVRGDCALPARKRYEGSLVVTGFLTIGAETTVVGDIKARAGASIGPRASVQGALTCESRVYVLPEASAWGPLVCESDLLIGARAEIGLPGAQTTVSARNIIVEEGAVVHGEVWAHELGMVKSV